MMRPTEMYLFVKVFVLTNQSFAQETIQLTTSEITTEYKWANAYAPSGDLSYETVTFSSSDDSLFYEQHKSLISTEPSGKNYADYYSMACTLWQLNKLPEAERMFLKIVNSTKSFYTKTYSHPSDIPGDHTKPIYVYGGFTSNHKNSACRYLTRIYLKTGKYETALNYIKTAGEKYPVSFGCGTGYAQDLSEVDALYAACYFNLGMYDTILDKYISNYADFNFSLLVQTIQKKYTPEEIRNYLQVAENSIICVVDSAETEAYIIHHFGQENEEKEPMFYTSGTGTIQLFGREVVMKKPILGKGQIVTRERFISDFKSSPFYRALQEV